MKVLTIRWQRLVEGGATCPRCGTTGDAVNEEWLGGTIGQRPCCEVCGPNECRTLTIEGRTHEAIPSELVVRAGLLAAASLTTAPTTLCCASTAVRPRIKGCCP